MENFEGVSEFLICTTPLLDVRSPSEFLHGHIPGAISFPLFNDKERAEVGTAYKQQGKDAAVKLGLYFVGPKLATFIEQADALGAPHKNLRLYCARGGMRSSSLAWLFEMSGFRTTVLKGGYKEFRNWTLDQFKKNYTFRVLSGLTGSGKTEHLHELERKREQIIDLEKLAGHQGSSFGHLGNPKQPSTEHFENMLAYDLSKFNLDLPVWIEDESRMIGCCQIPMDLWNKIGQSTFLWIECSKEERINRLIKMYGNHPKEKMIESTQRLGKKLGAVRTKQAIQCIQDADLKGAVSIVLEYYDQAYLHFYNRRKQRQPVRM